MVKEKTIVLAIIIQLLIASLSSVILVGLISFYEPDSIGQNTNIKIKVAVAGDIQSKLVGYLKSRNINVTTYQSLAEAQQDYTKGLADAVIYVPPQALGAMDLKLYLPESDTKSTVIVMVLKSHLKEYENYLRGLNGVSVNYATTVGRTGTSFEFLYSFIVPILMLFPTFIAGSIVIDSISEEFENKTMETLISSPVSYGDILGSKIIAAVIIAIIQCFMWSVLLFFNRIQIDNLLLVIALAGLLATIVSAGSGILALMFRDRERSQFIYSILLMLLAGLSSLMDPSPFSLMIRLATGDLHVGAMDVAIYIVPVALMLGGFYLAARVKIAARS